MADTLAAAGVTTISALQSVLPLQTISGHKKEKDVSPAFVDWSEADKHHRVQEVEVDLGADALFVALWGANAPVAVCTYPETIATTDLILAPYCPPGDWSRVAAFEVLAVMQKLCREKLAHFDYVETEWLPSTTAAEIALMHTAEKGSTAVQNGSDIVGAGYRSRCRMNVCHGTHFGKHVCSFERERCLEAATGGPYTVEICVRSTATMGERFRCIFLHRVVAVGDGRSRWTVDFMLNFVEKTNFLLRKTIETGAYGSVKRNFHTMAEVLYEYAAQQAQHHIK